MFSNVSKTLKKIVSPQSNYIDGYTLAEEIMNTSKGKASKDLKEFVSSDNTDFDKGVTTAINDYNDSPTHYDRTGACRICGDNRWGSSFGVIYCKNCRSTDR